MTSEQFRKEKLYYVTMSMAQNFLKKGLITETEYKQIDTIYSKKYGKTLCTILTDIDLIKSRNHGNI